MDRRLTAVVSVAVAVVAACSTSSSTPTTLCREAHRTVLLATDLHRGAPSRPFTIARGTTAWASTMYYPDPEQLFGNVGGVATLRFVAASSTPHIETDSRGDRRSRDPAVSLRKRAWSRVTVAAGQWRVYSIDLGVDPLPVTLVGCPGDSRHQPASRSR